MTHFLGRAAFASALLAAAATPALAAAATDMGVTTNVISRCFLSTTPVTFAPFTESVTAFQDGQGAVSVTCTLNTPWSLSAAPAGGSPAWGRWMHDGAGNALAYVLFKTSARNTLWGGQGVSGTTPITGTGTGATQLIPIYGRIGANQHKPAGHYADTVAVTVTY